jgi:hypothetical protein
VPTSHNLDGPGILYPLKEQHKRRPWSLLCNAAKCQSCSGRKCFVFVSNKSLTHNTSRSSFFTDLELQAACVYPLATQIYHQRYGIRSSNPASDAALSQVSECPRPVLPPALSGIISCSGIDNQLVQTSEALTTPSVAEQNSSLLTSFSFGRLVCVIFNYTVSTIQLTWHQMKFDEDYLE